MSFAGIYFSMFGHWWYSLLDRKFPMHSRNAVRNKVGAEALSGPLLVSSVFFLVGTLRGHSLEASWNNMKANFTTICGVEWLVYLPLQYINFKYVPPRFRYLYVATISIGYDIFLSFILHRYERSLKQELSQKIEQSNINPEPITKSSSIRTIDLRVVDSL